MDTSRYESVWPHTLSLRSLRQHYIVVCVVFWYLFSASTLFLNKYLLSYLHVDPLFLGLCQLTCATLCAYVYLFHVLPSSESQLLHHSQRRLLTPDFILQMTGMGVLRLLTSVLSLLAIKYVAVSFTETVKSSAPLFTVIISYLLLGEKTGWLVSLTLLPLTVGLSIASLYELHFDLRGFTAAIITVIVECLQNVYSKFLLSANDYKPCELQLYASFASVILQIFAYYLVFDWFISYTTPLQLFFILVNGLSFHAQTFTAYLLMSYISPVSYSVCNTAKRALLIFVSVLVFNNSVSPLSYLGTLLVLLGALCYGEAVRHVSGQQQQQKSQQAVLPVTDPVLIV